MYISCNTKASCLISGVGAGLMRVLYADGQIMADLVPVDMAVNALICAAWDIGKKHSTKMENVKATKTIEESSKTEKSETPSNA